ncbi:MAG: vitamin B12-dependent ribonucleotide reductase [Eubacteriales bacterium]
MNINENAKIVLQKRYLKKGPNGEVEETVEQLFERVAKTISSADKLYDKNADTKATEKVFYDMMTNLEFLPNSPTLMNAGRPLGQLSACFVLPVGDSMEEIFDAVKYAALIHKSGGGTGFSFSRLRQNGASVSSSGGIASGPVSFLKVFNMATEAVKQGGTRKGANMGILRIDHPDILEFINCKRDNADITNFNISVGITEEFMKAVAGGEDYALIDPNTKNVVKELNAKEVFDTIVNAAWKNGEPGIIFLDRLNKDNPVPKKGEIESTNPCGEQPLLPYEACNLGSINLFKMLNDKNEIDYEKLEKTVRNAVHFLDNVIEVNKYPLDIIDKNTKDTRKIGLGIMGFSDMLILMGIPYNSNEGVDMGRKVMSFIQKCGKEASMELAKTRGAFPAFSESTFDQSKPIRNATVTTIAPTGTLSMIAGCSSGIEPVFAYAYIRNVMDNTRLVEVNPILKDVLKKRGLFNADVMEKIVKNGTLRHIDEIPKDIKDVFVCAHDVSPEYHIRMQAAFQENIDNAVSKTVNFASSATPEDVRKVYLLAYELGCKGVTIYRDGSRDSQVLNIGSVKTGEIKEEIKEDKKLAPRERPNITTGFTEKMKIGCGNLYITVNYDDEGICEVFTNTGKHGGCPSQSEATARLVSMALRSGIDTKIIIDQLKGIRCPSTIRQPNLKVTSCPDAIAKMIEKVAKYQSSNRAIDELEAEGQNSNFKGKTNYCPECGAKVEHEGGCIICRNCGYSKCG